jgi:hypothetical protein
MRKLIVVFAIALCISGLWSQPPQGTLRIEVYDIGTGNSLNNAVVRVVSSDGSIDRTINTGTSYVATFANLPITLTYTATVSRTDYRTRVLPQMSVIRDASITRAAYLSSTLQTVGSIAGVVRDAITSQPLANAYVSATVSGRTVWVYTNTSGGYQISDLPRATYTVSADQAGYHPQSVSAAVSPNTSTEANLVLSPLSELVGDISGRVYDIISGSAVNGATVTLISDLGWSLTLDTGSGNFYRWDKLPVRARYRLAATAPNYRSTGRVGIVLSPNYMTEVNLYIASVLTSVGTLSGRIYDINTGVALPNAYVQVETQNRIVSVFISIQVGANMANVLLTSLSRAVGAWDFYGRNFGTGGNVNDIAVRITAPNGLSMTSFSGAGSNRERLQNLPVGTPLRIDAFAPGFRSRRYDNRYVRQGQIDSFEIWFVSEEVNIGRLQGRVTNMQTGLGVPNASVLLSQVGTGRWALTFTDSNGNFGIGDLYPATYDVSIGAAGYYTSTAYNFPVAVGDNLLEYAITPYNYPSGRLYGDVINAANGQGIPNSVVLLIASTGTTRLTYTGSTSVYNFYNLPYDQRYTVIGRAAGFQPGQVSNIEVPAFNEIRVNIPLNAGGAGLVGRLLLQGFTGNPAGRVQARVQIRDRQSGQVIQEATVTLGDSGAFVVPNVPSGTFKVWIKARGWLATLTDGITIPNLLPIVFESGVSGDANNDNIVDDADLLEVLFNFGQTGPGQNADLNYDEVVDDADLLIVLFNFGSQGDP